MGIAKGNHLKFIRSKSKELFEKEHIDSNSIVFIEDVKEIYLNGVFYKCNNDELEELIKNKADID